MSPQDLDVFTANLVMVAELLGSDLSETKQLLYFDSLRDLPLDDVLEALRKSGSRYRFMPKPIELRELVVGDEESMIESAWMALRKAMRRGGAYSSCRVESAALGDAIIAVFGGWIEACQMELTPEMWANKRKEFGRVYKVMLDRHTPGGRYLPGIIEQSNQGKAEWQKYAPIYVLSVIEASLSLPPHVETNWPALTEGTPS